MQGSSSCPGPGTSLQGSRQPRLARSEGGGLGTRRRGLDHGSALKPHSLPWSEIPTGTFVLEATATQISEPP